MAIPILRCADIEASLAFYTKLGASVLWHNRTGGPSYVAVRWHGHELHLSSHAGDSRAGAAAYLPVDDVDAVFAELRARGWQPSNDPNDPVGTAPTDQTWGMRELYVRDPDGNSLRFSTPVRR